MKQSLKDRRELQRNLKGFVTLSKYLLRGSQHEKTAGDTQPPERHDHDDIAPVATTVGSARS
jgi:hypothetical protein